MGIGKHKQQPRASKGPAVTISRCQGIRWGRVYGNAEGESPVDEATLKQAVTFGQGTLPGRRSGGKGGGRKHTTLPPSLQDPAGLPQAEPS